MINAFWIHFWIHCVRDVSPFLKFQRIRKCLFIRLPLSAPGLRKCSGVFLCPDYPEIDISDQNSDQRIRNAYPDEVGERYFIAVALEKADCGDVRGLVPQVVETVKSRRRKKHG